MTLRRLLALTAIVAAVLCGLAAPAAAVVPGLLVDVPGDDHGFTHRPGAPLVDLDRLAPGTPQATTFEVRNDSPDDARVDLSSFDVADEENGCVRPETREPGEGCDADGGELSGWLQVTVARQDGPASATLWSGAFSALAAGVTLTDALPAGGTWSLRVTVSLPDAATNATMTDTVTFGTRLRAQTAHGTTVVAMPTATAGAGVGGHTQVSAPSPGAAVLGPLAVGPQIPLPMTGTTVSLWVLLLAAALLLPGAALVSSSRRTRTVAVPVGRHRG